MDAEGWCLIDHIGAWQSFLCEFRVLEDVPAQHRSGWTWAWSYVLERILNAGTNLELNRALMWLLFLPQAFLRQPKRGGKLGRGLTAQRFNCLAQGDWGQLVTIWEKDKMIAEEKRSFQRSRGSNRKDLPEMKTKSVVHLISQGQVSREGFKN